MSTSISSVSSSANAQLLQRLKKLDADNNGQISKTEFVSGRPKNVDETTASSFFEQLTGSTTTDSVSLSDLASAFQQLAPQTQSAAIQTQSVHHKGRRDPAALFDSLDTDGDGSLTKAEFVAGRPQGISESDAGGLFDNLSSGSDTLTKDQFLAAAPPPPPPSMSGGGPRPPMGAKLSGFDDDQDSDATTSAKSTSATSASTVSTQDLKTLLEQLLATLNSQLAANTSSSAASSTSSSVTAADAASA